MNKRKTINQYWYVSLIQIMNKFQVFNERERKRSSVSDHFKESDELKSQQIASSTASDVLPLFISRVTQKTLQFVDQAAENHIFLFADINCF